MSEIKEFDIMPYDGINNGDIVYVNHWPTERVQVIRMKDGSYALGIDMEYNDGPNRFCRETCRIYLDKYNRPYVKPGEPYDFTPENCMEKIDSFEYSSVGAPGHKQTIDDVNAPLLTLIDGIVVPEKSIFTFPAHTRNEVYFRRHDRSASLNAKGLSLVLKFVENPENKPVMDKRMKPISNEKLSALKTKMQECFNKFLEGEASISQMKSLMETYKTLTAKNAINNEPIDLDLKSLDRSSDPTPNK